MKKNLVTLVLATCFLAIGEAKAAIDCMNNATCHVSVPGDTGAGLKRCRTGASYDCTCTKHVMANYGCAVTDVRASCSGTWNFAGYVVSGQSCCYDANYCANPHQANSSTSIEVTEVQNSTETNEESLGVVFGQEPEFMTDNYWGYAGTTLRSPNAGRTTSAAARLDACLYYSDVNNLPGTTNYDKWLNCKGSVYGCDADLKNEYCQADYDNDGSSTSAGRCKDRCDCLYGYGTCENY